MHTLLRATLATAITAAAGCGGADAPTVPTTPVPEIAFTYGGPVAGSWRAAGHLNTSTAAHTTWAAGKRQGGNLMMQANLVRPDGKHDWIIITLTRTTAGTQAVDPACGASTCPEVWIAYGLKNEHGAQADQSCWLESGTLRLDEIGAGRARGTFSGTGSCLAADGTPGDDFTVTGGTFDVALI
jgi:hypothetical protein